MSFSLINIREKTGSLKNKSTAESHSTRERWRKLVVGGCKLLSLRGLVVLTTGEKVHKRNLRRYLLYDRKTLVVAVIKSWVAYTV